MNKCLKHGHAPKEFWLGEAVYYKCSECLVTRVKPFEAITPVKQKFSHAIDQAMER